MGSSGEYTPPSTSQRAKSTVALHVRNAKLTAVGAEIGRQVAEMVKWTIAPRSGHLLSMDRADEKEALAAGIVALVDQLNDLGAALAEVVDALD